jgi:hypothetical protein
MGKIIWTLKTLKTADLIEWADNPRKISKKDFRELKNSFKEFDQARTLTVAPDGSNYVIIGGNQSKRALLELGYEEIQCSVANRELNEEEKRKLSVLLNPLTKGQGVWDYDILKTWDIDIKEHGIQPEKVMAKSFKFDNGEFKEVKAPYPVTIIITAEDYEEWTKIKAKIKKDNDRDAFFNILKKLDYSKLE